MLFIKRKSLLFVFVTVIIGGVSCNESNDALVKKVIDFKSLNVCDQDTLWRFLHDEFEISFDGEHFAGGRDMYLSQCRNYKLLNSSISISDAINLGNSEISLEYYLKNDQLNCLGIDSLLFEENYKLKKGLIYRLVSKFSSKNKHITEQELNSRMLNLQEEFYTWLKENEPEKEVELENLQGEKFSELFITLLKDMCKETPANPRVMK